MDLPFCSDMPSLHLYIVLFSFQIVELTLQSGEAQVTRGGAQDYHRVLMLRLEK